MTVEEGCEQLSDVELAKLKAIFEQAMREMYNERKAAPYRYYATGLLKMRSRRQDWVQTAKDVLWSPGETSEGLNRLCLEGRLNLSVQAFVLKPEFRCLFTKEDRQQAHDTLCSYDFRVAWDTHPCSRTHCKCVK